MGNGNGAARSDLFAEQWDYRTVAAQHVAKPCGDELGFLSFALSVIEQRLAINLG